MSTSIKEIFISLKRNGFDISLSELEEILAGLVEEGFIQRQMLSRSERTEQDGQDCFTDVGQFCFPYLGSNCSATRHVSPSPSN
ncbi:MAG TPA: hypothetical protein VEL11_11645 [Candidatus Bathyarchaeia archaeon]|nr:hypothetical protein [Candidatus Bathyarchaeia archaeon]